MNLFQEAKAVWTSRKAEAYNQFVGFHTCVSAGAGTEVTIAIAARSYYRLYINGRMAAHGPARTAKNYCRVDRVKGVLNGKTHIAIEVAAYDKPEKYCNDCTMEPGMLAAEIQDGTGRVLSATGKGGWTCRELGYRRTLVETMSHCRGIVEYYDLDSESFAWRGMELEEEPIVLAQEPVYLERRAPYPTYRRIPFGTLQAVCDIGQGEETGEDLTLLARLVNRKWYEMVPEENLFLNNLRREKELSFTGNLSIERIGTAENQSTFGDEPQGASAAGHQSVRICPGQDPAALVWEMPESEVGFLCLEVTVGSPCILDLVHSDHLHVSGKLRGNSYAARYCLQPGHYELITFEPKLAKYVKVILRTEGEAELSAPALMEYTYPECRAAHFQCNDGDLNRIYEAAERTLRLNTLDIFMDCPERERGGWLCDSYFTSRGAWQMLGDLSVEKDFLENFMLTDSEETWKGFFPEVYPGVHPTRGEVGIRNWSFWLPLELYEYYLRSGDREFVERWKGRVADFIEGVLSLRGESGLLEQVGTQFVDWSLSNKSFALEPISIPVNCLAVCMLERTAELYGQLQWKQAADEMRAVIKSLDDGGLLGGRGDAASLIPQPDAVHEQKAGGGDASGRTKEPDFILRRGECQTESGIALELWSGFHLKDRKYIRQFAENMGSCPTFRPDPNIGKANLFIGLMIRFDVLARLGRTDLLIREWKDLYLEQLKVGSGTFFEHIASFSGCHGFNGCVGAMLTNLILGLGEPLQLTRTVRISPHPGRLKWASGSARCQEGTIFLRWSADETEHVLDMMLILPKGWTAQYEMPFELTGWTVRVNGERLCLEAVSGRR